MFNPLYVKLLKTVFSGIKNENEANPEEVTAPESVFKKVEESLENTSSEEASGRSREELYKGFMEKLKHIQTENEANPEEQTAPPTVFEKMQKQIDDLQRQVAEAERNDVPVSFEPGPSYNPNPGQPTAKTSPRMPVMAMTQSDGGSIVMRADPAMGSAQNSTRIPHGANIQIIGYSDKGINLDGHVSKWVRVDYNGQRGWIFDKYLDFTA